MNGLEIKIKRLKSGLKGYELARQVGITPDKMSQFESGRSVPNADMLARILHETDRQNSKSKQEDE